MHKYKILLKNSEQQHVRVGLLLLTLQFEKAGVCWQSTL